MASVSTSIVLSRNLRGHVRGHPVRGLPRDEKSTGLPNANFISNIQCRTLHSAAILARAVTSIQPTRIMVHLNRRHQELDAEATCPVLAMAVSLTGHEFIPSHHCVSYHIIHSSPPSESAYLYWENSLMLVEREAPFERPAHQSTLSGMLSVLFRSFPRHWLFFSQVVQVCCVLS